MCSCAAVLPVNQFFARLLGTCNLSLSLSIALVTCVLLPSSFRVYFVPSSCLEHMFWRHLPSIARTLRPSWFGQVFADHVSLSWVSRVGPLVCHTRYPDHLLQGFWAMACRHRARRGRFRDQRLYRKWLVPLKGCRRGERNFNCRFRVLALCPVLNCQLAL